MTSPATNDELVAAVRATPRLLPVGAGTKPRLARAPAGFTPLSLRSLRGLVEYEPDEFTFTARAGTPLAEIAAILAARGQYLPFDPPFAAAGATLGGTVAAGLSGPGRFRYGGVRDFILGVRFVDGEGRLLRLGGKVVKNAAGFDVPKFLVGSAGRFGVVAEITMKVFPRPAASRTLRLACPDLPSLLRTVTDLAATAWEPDAIEASPADRTVHLRLAGPAEALDTLATAATRRFGGTMLTDAEASDYWTGLADFKWAFPNGVLLKIPVTPAQVSALLAATAAFADTRIHLGNAANVAWLSLPEPAVPAALDSALRTLGLTAVTLRGDGPPFPGSPPPPAIAAAVKHALDPHGRFPDLGI